MLILYGWEPMHACAVRYGPIYLHIQLVTLRLRLLLLLTRRTYVGGEPRAGKPASPASCSACSAERTHRITASSHITSSARRARPHGSSF